MAGAGFSRAGLDPAGLGSAGRSVVQADNNAVICQRIDPARRDYAHGEDDYFESMPIITQRVLTALGNKVGSFSGNPTDGDPSLTIDRDNGKLVATVTAYTRARLADMVAAKEIEIVSIDVQVVNGAYKRVVTFRDVSTNRVLTA